MKLYQYMKSTDHVMSAILQNGVYFADPTKFNDPYEKHILVKYHGNDVSIYDPKSLGQVKIACFCENNDDYLMWSLYANGHRGFCVEYDIEISDVPNNGIVEMDYVLKQKIYFGKVRYSDKTLSVKSIESTFGSYDFFKRFLHKFRKWNYEKEIRAFHDHDTPYVVSCQRINITAVYCGQSCDDQMITNIKNLCKGQDEKITVYRSLYNYKQRRIIFSRYNSIL